MTRKIWALICLTLALGISVHEHMAGTAADRGLLLESFTIMWVAYMLPAGLPVILVERYGFHLAPWGDGNTVWTLLWLTVTASAIWFFPVARIERWFGTFDPFTASDRPRPRILGAAVWLFEQTNKRLFGRQKTGGWA